jgi:hypothetical protein
LEDAGTTFGYLGGCAGALGLIAAFFLMVTGQITWAVVCGITAIVAFVQGSVIDLLFKAGAEIIRLLKKSNGLKFNGEISGPTFVVSYVCSACGVVVPPIKTKCGGCGVEFEPSPTKEKTSPP